MQARARARASALLLGGIASGLGFVFSRVANELQLLWPSLSFVVISLPVWQNVHVA